MLQENGQVFWDFIRTNKVGSIWTCVKFLTKVFAHLVNLRNRIGESNIRVLGVVETNCSETLKFIFFSGFIDVLFFFSQFNALTGLKITDAVQSADFALETAQMVGIVLGASV